MSIIQRGSGSPRRFRPGLVVALLVLVLGAYNYRWVADDAMIDFRIVDNLLHGHGPVYNIGERVEVYTNPLWVLLLAVARLAAFFLPMGTVAVVLGIGLTVVAVSLAWRIEPLPTGGVSSGGTMRAGLMGLCAVPAMWEFATSGLETSLSFFWIALAAWCVSNQPLRRRTSVVVGLGTLVRPDLGILMVALLAMNAVAVVRSGAGRRQRLEVVVWGAMPTVLYEVFRVMYFGLLVSNTALTKSATSLRPGVGWAYVADFFTAYWLTVPLVILVVWWVVTQRPWTSGYWRTQGVFGALVVGGFLNLGYVVAIGGDFMHARLLLPSLFAVSTALRVPFRVRTLALSLLGATYLVVVVASLRYTQPGLRPHLMVTDERLMEIGLTKNAHPVNETDMTKSIWWQYGEQLHRLAARQSGSSPVLVLGSSPTVLTGPVNFPLTVTPARRPTTRLVTAPSRTLGQVGLAAGPNVSLFDVLSLANPVSSHFTLGERIHRPGHEKEADLSWFLGRYGSPENVWWMNYRQGFFQYPVVSVGDVTAASAALDCDPLRRYVEATTSPLTLRRLVSNALHATSWTRMSYSPQPTVAQQQLCRG